MDISAKNILCKLENIKALAGAVHYEKNFQLAKFLILHWPANIV